MNTEGCIPLASALPPAAGSVEGPHFHPVLWALGSCVRSHCGLDPDSESPVAQQACMAVSLGSPEALTGGGAPGSLQAGQLGPCGKR